ncbi:MAG: DUF2380 domain-containing protein [Chitinispirillaceae bacterium]|nr:DUF2380 domain-containing protein [Chitinispirillaceae bacterium]
MRPFGTIFIACVVLLSITLFTETFAEGGKTNYAVVNLKAGDGVSEGESELITDRLRTELFKTGKVNMMERNQMQEILKEQGFQQSGVCTDEACLVEMGQMLGVKIMVIGSLGKLGSMFMVNIRAIDVQTAQVVKVVSVDIKGDIEEVVEHLPDIARNITGAETAVPPPELPPPEPAKQEPEPEPQAKVEPPSPPEPEVTPEETDDNENEAVVKKAYETPEKNKNRSGVGFTFNFFGPPVHHIYSDNYDYYDSIWVLDPDVGDYVFINDENYEKDASLFIDYLIRFYIRAGKYLNIEIGPHFTAGTETYTYTGSLSYVESEFFSGYYIPGVHLGLDFVKRFHPLKINVGVFGNISFPLIYYSIDYSDYLNNDYLYEECLTPFFRFIPGIRTGAEILFGDHFGFSADFVFQVVQFEFDYDFDEFDEGLFDYQSTDMIDMTQEVQFLRAGLAISANIYF